MLDHLYIHDKNVATKSTGTTITCFLALRRVARYFSRKKAKLAVKKSQKKTTPAKIQIKWLNCSKTCISGEHDNNSVK